MNKNPFDSLSFIVSIAFLYFVFVLAIVYGYRIIAGKIGEIPSLLIGGCILIACAAFIVKSLRKH